MIEILETLNLYSSLIVAIATVFLVIITSFYVFYTKKILQENKKMREDTYKIIVRTKEFEAFCSLCKRLSSVILKMSKSWDSTGSIEKVLGSMDLFIGESSIPWVELAEDFLQEYDNCFFVLPVELKIHFCKARENLKKQIEYSSANKILGLPNREDYDILVKIWNDMTHKGQEIFGLRSFPVD